MISVDSLDDHQFESFVPALCDDVIVRRYDQEAIVWSPFGDRATYLDPVGSIVLQLLDGSVTIAELADDIRAEVGVPRSVVLGRLRAVVRQLDSSGVLKSSDSPPLASDDFFYGPPNP